MATKEELKQANYLKDWINGEIFNLLKTSRDIVLIGHLTMKFAASEKILKLALSKLECSKGNNIIQVTPQLTLHITIKSEEETHLEFEDQ